MTCASCVGRIERALSAVPGVISASVNLATEKATVSATGGLVTRAVLEATVKEAGYDVRQVASEAGAKPVPAADRKAAEARKLSWAFGLSAVLTAPLVCSFPIAAGLADAGRANPACFRARS